MGYLQVLLLTLLLLNSFGCNKSAPSTVQVQRAVDQALDWTKKGGTAEVLGVQEISQANTARADIKFNQFQYNSDQVGTPIAKTQQAPRTPDMNSPSFYEDLYKYGTQQTKVTSYSGNGMATLTHYSDGRWVLTGIQFNFVELNTNVEIR